MCSRIFGKFKIRKLLKDHINDNNIDKYIETLNKKIHNLKKISKIIRSKQYINSDSDIDVNNVMMIINDVSSSS